MLLKATPLIVIALGLAVCYRSNVWNIGAEGQYLLGALAGGGMALWLTTQGIVLPKILSLPLVLIAGVLGGMLWAAIVALLRDRFNANEILVSLMLVYVAQQLVNYLVFGPWKDPAGFNFPQTKTFDASTWLPALLDKTRLHIGFLVALAMVGAIWVFLFRSFKGFQLQVGGLAPQAARYAGFSARTALWTALMISGGMAGLAVLKRLIRHHDHSTAEIDRIERCRNGDLQRRQLGIDFDTQHLEGPLGGVATGASCWGRDRVARINSTNRALLVQG